MLLRVVACRTIVLKSVTAIAMCRESVIERRGKSRVDREIEVCKGALRTSIEVVSRGTDLEQEECSYSRTELKPTFVVDNLLGVTGKCKPVIFEKHVELFRTSTEELYVFS